MKITTYYQNLLIIFSIIVIVSCVCAVKQASAQAGPAATAIAEIKPLKIGDKVPDELWNHNFPVVSAGNDQSQRLKLGDYRDKLIILDFWATWCGSCYKGLTNLNQWQKDFKDELLVVPVSYQESDEIKKVLSNKEWDFSSVFNDKMLKEYFPHKFLPHQVIVSAGKVLAISSGAQVNEDKISAMLKGDDVGLRVKDDIVDFDKNAILLQNENPRFREKLVYGSSFFKNIDGLGSYFGISEYNDYQRLYFTNKRIIDFYFTVVNPLIRNRIFFEVNDFSRINYDMTDQSFEREQWELKNSFCYELIAPKNTSKNELYKLALPDFDRHFNLESKWVTREMDCYVIINREGKQFTDPFKGQQPGENQLMLPFETLLRYLNNQLPGRPQRPIFISESNVEMSIPILITKGKYKEPDDLQQILQNYGLEVKKAKRNLEVLVIRDKS